MQFSPPQQVFHINETSCDKSTNQAQMYVQKTFKKLLKDFEFSSTYLKFALRVPSFQSIDVNHCQILANHVKSGPRHNFWNLKYNLVLAQEVFHI